VTGVSAAAASAAANSATAPPVAVIACGALGASIRRIVEDRCWQVELHVLPALLHNRPQKIAPAVEQLARRLLASGLPVVLAYADCGSYGALDDVCERLGIRRLHGLHCYDVFAGREKMQELFADEPGTYVLTDFLVRSFRRSVLCELGLDRHPELWSDYFGHYRRVVWLAQSRTDSLEAEALGVAGMFGLPLEVLDAGVGSLEFELEELLGCAAQRAPRRSGQGAGTGLACAVD